MYFKRIDMHGFKSFAEPVSIEFHEGITCIVGPNGSGKSNISDAIRWVLGEQSPKMLRGGKMEEVIFAGTANRKSRGMAEVTLVIDNSKNILPIDYGEVAITRRMYRSGESEYSINKNQCRLKDIRELIMDTGIGVDGYSLIGQGKIADIVSNKTESRREIFEEAAGIVKYRSKKAESERKLEASRGNLERVNDIVVEIEGRIDGLKEDSKKAAEYLTLRDRYRELEINVTLKNIEAMQLKTEYVKDDLSQLGTNIDDLKDEKVKIDIGINTNRIRNEELESLSNNTRDKLLESTTEINTLINQTQLNQEKLTAMAKDKERLGLEIEGLERKLEKEDGSSKEIFENKEKIDKELVVFAQTLTDKIAIYAEKSGVLNKTSQDIDLAKNKIYELHTFISNQNSEINSLVSLQGTLGRRREQILTEKELSDDENGKIDEGLAGTLKEQEAVVEKMESLSENRQKENIAYNESVTNERTLSKRIEECNVEVGQTSTRKKMIEEMESNYEGYNHAVKFIMKSSLSNINGVVAELINVPNGFETAIETALGAAMQNIVCQDDKSAQAAISLLKSNRAGRLTFLPLDSIKTFGQKQDNGLRNAVGFKGFGTECIQFDPQYKGVMDYLLGRVVVVDKLENAVKLSKTTGGGLRFVTLDGEVINSGGAITGGAYRNNTANLLERKAEIGKLTERLKLLEQEQQDGKEKLSLLRNAISQGILKIQEIEREHRACEIELLNLQNHIKVIETQMTVLKGREEKWAMELSSIEEENLSSNKMIEEMKARVATAQEEMQGVEGKIESGLSDYDGEKIKLESVNDEITKARIAVNSAESEKNNLDQIVSRIQTYMAELKEEVSVKHNTIEELKAEEVLLCTGDSNLAETARIKETEKAALEAFLMELIEEKTSVVKVSNQLAKEKEDLEEKLAALQGQRYELEIKQAKNDTQLENYKNKLWEEFEISYLQAMEFRKKEFNMNNAVRENREIKSRMKELGEVNIGAIKEYEVVSERYGFLTGQRDDLLQAMATLNKIIEDMDKTIRANFKESFDKIVVNFEEAFQQLFGGGNAELRLEDESRPLECGIEIVAQPPGKKLQNINLMSGGEKTMTAIALMFAVLRAKPTPFCILDEVEAALDDANIDRFARYLTTFNEIQFTLVTHQKATMEYADVLYGVTMPEQGISKVISLKLGEEIGV